MDYIIMRVKFKEGVSQETMDNVTAKFYKDNEQHISGMCADTLKDEEAYKDFMKIYKEFQSK